MELTYQILAQVPEHIMRSQALLTCLGLLVLCCPHSASNGRTQADRKPFMEHPTGDFKTAVDAIANAVKRLRALQHWKDWITFTAQGAGSRPDSIRSAEIRLRKEELRLQKGIEIDPVKVTQWAGVNKSWLSKAHGIYSLAKATPIQAARIMDVIFRKYLECVPILAKAMTMRLGLSGKSMVESTHEDSWYRPRFASDPPVLQ